MNFNDNIIKKRLKAESTNSVVRILEVTAVPPKILAFKNDGTSSTKPIDAILGGIQWITTLGSLDGFFYASEPLPRKLPAQTIVIKDFSGNDIVINTGTAWFPENKGGEHNTNYEVDIEWTDPVTHQRTVVKHITGDLLSDLKACNMEGNAINYWEVPSQYITADYQGHYDPTQDTVQGYFRAIRGNNLQGFISFAPSAVVYNNKARYGQSIRITAYSPESGDRMDNAITDIISNNANPGNTTFTLPYSITADIRADGCPYFMWTFINRANNAEKRLQFIRGARWKKVSLAATAINGNYFDKLQARQNSIMPVLGLAGGAIGGAIAGYSPAVEGSLGKIMYMGRDDYYNYDMGLGTRQKHYKRVGYREAQPASWNPRFAIGGALGGYAISSLKQVQQQELLSAQAVCASTPQFIGNGDFIRDIDPGTPFRYIYSSYSPEDMVAFDSFLTKFGYNVGNMMIGTDHFYSRRDFVYMRINDITIRSEKAGQELLDKVTEQLKAGVRIWRVAPNIDSMLPSGNRTPSNIKEIKNEK